MLEYLDHMSPTLDSRYKFDNGFLLYESGLPYVGLGQHPYHRPESFWGKLVDRQILIADLDCLESQNSFGKLLSLDNSGFTFTPPIPHALNAIVDELINGFFRKEHGLVEQLADGVEGTLFHAKQISVLNITQRLADQYDQVPDFLQVNDGSETAACTGPENQVGFAMQGKLIQRKADAKIHFRPYTKRNVSFRLDLRQRIPVGVSAGQRTGVARVLAEVGWWEPFDRTAECAADPSPRKPFGFQASAAAGLAGVDRWRPK